MILALVVIGVDAGELIGIGRIYNSPLHAERDIVRRLKAFTRLSKLKAYNFGENRWFVRLGIRHRGRTLTKRTPINQPQTPDEDRCMHDLKGGVLGTGVRGH